MSEQFKSQLKAQLKALFETPEKTRITVSCLAVALATAAAIVYVLCAPRSRTSEPGASSVQSQAVSGAPEESGTPEETDGPEPSAQLAGLVPALTMDEARALALEDAGVDEPEAEVVREALEEDNGIWVYALQFRTERARYEYKINANTGEVRTMIREIFPSPAPEVTPAPMPSMPALPEESTPPEEEPSRESPDPEDSAPPEETEPQPAPSADPDPSPSPSADLNPSPSPSASQNASLYIGMAQAKAAALSHAGLSAAQAVITRESMRRDNGLAVYFIEFRGNGVRYQYTIDAQSGAVLEALQG